MIDKNRPLLLIEDSDEDFEITSMLLRNAGVANPVLRCSTGTEAMDYIERRKQFLDAPEPLLILLDLNIPGIDGRRILAALRKCEWLSAAPAIVLSTSTNPRDVRLCYQLGAAGYLVKPVDLAKFECMIQGFTQYWLSTVVLSEAEEHGYASAPL